MTNDIHTNPHPTPEQVVENFNTHGVVPGIEFFDEASSLTYYEKHLQSLAYQGIMQTDLRCKSQVLFPWVAEIAQSENILKHIRPILGNDMHCWDTLLWIKEPGDSKFVSPHQDATYWNLTPKHRVLTVWLSLTDINANSGGIQYMLGSHKLGQTSHADVHHPDNLLMRGQTSTAPVAAFKLYSPTYARGHGSIHHAYMYHGSPPNTSGTTRLALGLIYAAADVVPIETYAPESTLWVSGDPDTCILLKDLVPRGGWQDVHAWKGAYDRQHNNYYKMRKV